MHNETVADTDGPPSNTLEEVAAGRIVPKSVHIYERKARASSLQMIGIEFTFEDNKHAAHANDATTISGDGDGTGVEQTFDALPVHAIANQYAHVPNISSKSHYVNMSTAQHHEFEEVVTSLSLPSPRQLAGWPNASGTYLSPRPDRRNMLGIGNAYDTGGSVAPQPLSSGERQYSHVFHPSQPLEQTTPMSEVFLTPNEGFTPFSPAISTTTTLDSDGRDDQLLETPDIGGNALDRLVLLSPTATPSTLASSPGDIGGYTYTTPLTNPYLYLDHVPGDIPTYGYTLNKCGGHQSECVPSHLPPPNVQDQFANTNTIDNQNWNWDWLEISNTTIYNPANPTVDDGRDNPNHVNVHVASNATNTANVLNANENDPSSFNVQGTPSVDFGHSGWFDALFPPSAPGTAGYSGTTYPPLDPTSDPSTHQIPEGSYHQSSPPSQLVGPFSSPTQFIPPTSTNTSIFAPTSSPIPTSTPAPGLSLAARLSSPNHSPAGLAYVHYEDSSEGSANPLSLYDRIYNYKRVQKRRFPLNKQMLMQYIADGMSVTKLFPYTVAGSRGGNPTTPSQVLSDDGEQDLDQDNDAGSPRLQEGPFICHGTHRLSKKPENMGEWERMVCVTSSASMSAYQKHIKMVHLGLSHRQLSLLKWLTAEGFYASTGKPTPTSLVQNRAICVVHLQTGEEPQEQWLAYERGSVSGK